MVSTRYPKGVLSESTLIAFAFDSIWITFMDSCVGVEVIGVTVTLLKY